MNEMLKAPRVRVWAHDNALTLIFVAAFFVLTWIVTALVEVFL